MTVSMNPTKPTYAEELKTPFPTLNAVLTAKPSIAKPTRVRLSESAKANLRAVICGESDSTPAEPNHQPVIYEQPK